MALVLFDLDGVVFDFLGPWTEWTDKHGYPTPRDLDSHELGYELHEFAQIHDDLAARGFFAEQPANTDTIAVINRFLELGHEVGYLTSRQSFTGDEEINAKIQEDTRKNFQKYGIPKVENLRFCAGFKRDMILEMGAHCIVDDHSGTCEDISLLTAPDGKPIQAFMLTVPYNRVSNYEHRINYISEMLEKFSR